MVDDSVRERMKDVLKEIQSGAFAKEWNQENAEGGDRYQELLKGDLEHPIENVGERLRARMPWLQREEAA